MLKHLCILQGAAVNAPLSIGFHSFSFEGNVETVVNLSIMDGAKWIPALNEKHVKETAYAVCL